MTIASQLAEFSLTTFNTDMPKSVLEKTKHAMLDQYGLQLGGSVFPWSESIYKYTQTCYTADPNGSTIASNGLKFPVVQAAFVNSCFAHAQDFDDAHQEAQTHPSSVIIPAAMAISEMLNKSGLETLKAIALGIEVMLRLSCSICPACIEGGHHTPPTTGPFGAAIACGLLLGLNQKELTNALGICGSYSGGLMEYTISGGSTKRIHTALGARAGLEAALLAKEGITGPNTIIEGNKGVWAIFGRKRSYPERLFDKIDKHYMLLTLLFKPYNCCFFIHPAIQGFLTLCHDHSITEEDIEIVHVGLSAFSVSHAGQITIPTDALGAQFSTSFTLALSLIKGPPEMHSYHQQNLTDANILNLAKRIKIEKDKQADAEFPKHNGCYITITTKNKTQFSIRIQHPKGSPKDLMTLDEIKMKYLKNSTPIIGEVAAQALCEQLLDFDKLCSVQEFMRYIIKT